VERRRGKVGVDFDGVIANTGNAKKLWIKNNLNLDISSADCGRSMLCSAIGAEQYEIMQRSMRIDDTLLADPLPGAIDSLKQLSEMFDVIVVTSRGTEKIGWAKIWLKNNGVGYLCSETLSAQNRSKLSLLGEDAICLVDDDYRHLSPLLYSQVRRMWFGHLMPTHKEELCGPRIEVVSDWPSVMARLL